MFFWMSWHARQIVLADTYVSSSNLALSVEQFVARTVETIDLSLRVAVEEIGAEGTKSPAEGQALLAERVRQSPQMTSLMVIDAEGNKTRVGSRLEGDKRVRVSKVSGNVIPDKKK